MIRLSPEEIALADAHGEQKRLEAIRLDFRDHAGIEVGGAHPVEVDRLGARCELAFAKFRGVAWTPTINDPNSEDVDGFEVRGTTHKRGGLIVRPNNITSGKATRPFSLVVQWEPGVYNVVGWFIGSDAIRDEWIMKKEGRKDAWLVPQARLHRFYPRSSPCGRLMFRADEIGTNGA